MTETPPPEDFDLRFMDWIKRHGKPPSPSRPISDFVALPGTPGHALLQEIANFDPLPEFPPGAAAAFANACKHEEMRPSPPPAWIEGGTWEKCARCGFMATAGW